MSIAWSHLRPTFGLRDYGVSGQIGLEETPEQYVAKLVEVFREVRRVLREDGVVFLNLGDRYQDKQLVGVPWRVAFALQDDGWFLRSAIVWHKPNAMPESVTDRPTKDYEHVFLLAKNARYFYDADAIREKSVDPEGSAARYKSAFGGAKNEHLLATDQVHTRPIGMREFGGTRNKRTVWTISTKPLKDAHFATFPPDLVEPMILAGTSERGVCSECGTPWERVVEIVGYDRQRWAPGEDQYHTQAKGKHGSTSAFTTGNVAVKETTGWRLTCDCDAGGTVPATVLDPFAGACTTGLVAARLGRDAILIELNADYAEMGSRRIRDDAGMFVDVEVMA